MFKQMLKILLMLAVVGGASGAPYGGWLSGAEAHAATITLPKTGQTKCYDPTGTTANEIACAGTGQDANKLKGADWPVPRFIDNSNGTVTDNLTGLIWLKNANCAATLGGVVKTTTLTWLNAITWSNNLKGDNTACTLNDGSVVGDWRLPNSNELESLVDAQKYNPSLPTGHPFSNVQANDYWSSSSYARNTSYAWYVGMSDGYMINYGKTNNYYVWPVRAGQLGDSVISVLPAAKDFGALAASGSSSQTVTISNSGATSRLEINAMVLSGTNANQFSLNVGDASGGTCGSTTPIIPPGGSCTVSVTFTPTTGGEKRANLRVSGSDVNTPNVDIPLNGYLQGTMLIPKTGQTLCYDMAGTTIACAGTGQDGDKQAGAAQSDPLFTDNGNGTITDKVYGMTWQKDAGRNGATIKTGINAPATRFTDNGNGTQTDNLTGLVWLKDANCSATVGGVTKTTTLTWPDALTWSNNLKSGDCSLSDGSVAGDWRLPNINELASLPTNYSGRPVDWLNNAAQGFTNVQDYYFYWSSRRNYWTTSRSSSPGRW